MRYRKVCMLCLALAIVAAACGGSSATSSPSGTSSTSGGTAESRSAKLSDMQKQVEAREKEGADWQTAFEGQQIAAGGGVKTGEEARARLDIAPDGAIVRLAASTVFSLTALSPEPKDPVTRLQLEAGKMWASVSKALGLGTFEIDTPVGVATVRGSFMSTEFFPGDGHMIVTCLEGQCRLTGKHDPSKFTDLNSGQQAGIPGYGQDPGPAITIDSAQLADWGSEFPEAQSFVATITPGPPPTPTSTPSAPGGGGSAGGGLTACDHPYFPLRAGSTWSYSTESGAYTWVVSGVTGDTNSATAEMDWSIGDVQGHYTWQCDTTGIVSYQFGSLSTTQFGQVASYKVVSHSGTFLPPVDLLVPGYAWNNDFTIEMTFTEGASMTGTSANSEHYQVTGAEPVTVGGQTYDGLQISGGGTMDIQVNIPGLTTPPTHMESTNTFVLARGIGIIRTTSSGGGSASASELTSFTIP